MKEIIVCYRERRAICRAQNNRSVSSLVAQYTTVCPTGGNKMQLYDPLVERLNFVLGETQYCARNDLRDKQTHL